MKKYFYIAMLAATILSCKEKNEGSNTDTKTSISDSLKTNPTDSKVEINDAVETVENTTYKEAQKLYHLDSDTVYVTNYWATWCGPCVQEIPDFVALQEENNDKKVKIIFMNVDESNTQNEVEPFVAKNKMKNVYHISIQDLAENIGKINPDLAQGIPVTVVQKGKHIEGLIGNQSKEFMTSKIQEYSNK